MSVQMTRGELIRHTIGLLIPRLPQLPSPPTHDNATMSLHVPLSQWDDEHIEAAIISLYDSICLARDKNEVSRYVLRPAMTGVDFWMQGQINNVTAMVYMSGSLLHFLVYLK